MALEFDIVDSAAAAQTVKENAFVTMLDGAESPFKDLEIGKSVTFKVPASNPDEIKAADKLKKDLGEHIRHLRPENSPLVKSRDEHNERIFVATITKRVKRERKPDDAAAKGGSTAKPAAAKAAK